MLSPTPSMATSTSSRRFMLSLSLISNSKRESRQLHRQGRVKPPSSDWDSASSALALAFGTKESNQCKWNSNKNRNIIVASDAEKQIPTRRSQRVPRRLISIGTSDTRWHSNWTCDYIVSLRDLHLDDLVEIDQSEAQVLINLSIQKHASFGLSIDGKISTSFTRKCSNCYSSYCRAITANFNVWVLSSARVSRGVQLPELGGDDPSVIYVKPGSEAHLDSLVQDTLRLAISAKDTCSEICEKSESTLQYIGGEKAASIDKRWSMLLRLRNNNPNLK